MVVTKISDALQMPEDQLVMAISGVIKDVFKQSSGGAGEKAWTVQHVILQGGGAQIKLSVWNRETLSRDIVGKTVYIESTKGTKGWNGMKIKVGEYNGKKETTIGVNPTANISFPDSSGSPPTTTEDPPEEARQESKSGYRASDPPRSKPEAEPKRNPDGDARARLLHARKWAGRYANAIIICSKAAHHVAEEHANIFGEEMTPEHIQAATTSMFIQMMRDNIVTEEFPYDSLGNYSAEKK